MSLLEIRQRSVTHERDRLDREHELVRQQRLTALQGIINQSARESHSKKG